MNLRIFVTSGRYISDMFKTMEWYFFAMSDYFGLKFGERKKNQ